MDSKNKVILVSVIAGILVIGLVVSAGVTGKATRGSARCEWSWPQKVIVGGETRSCGTIDGEWRPYCNAAGASCCKRGTGNSSDYIDCVYVGTSTTTLAAGNLYYLRIGDMVDVGADIVRLEDIGDAKVAISVDGGEIVTVDEDAYNSWPGITLRVIDVFYKPGNPTTSTAVLAIWDS